MKKKDIKKPSYPTFNEFSSKKFLNIATAIGIGVSAAAISVELDAEEKKVTESKTDKEAEAKKAKDQIILLAANLGHKDFKEREKATKLLISMGNKYKQDKNVAMSNFMKTELNKSCSSKDPEVKKRSKMVLVAIAPKPVKRDHPRIGGLVRPAGGMRSPK